MITVKAYANCDHAYVVWKTKAVIHSCLGFALYRQVKGETEQTVETFVGPATGPKVADGTSRPSTIWPIQKFMWADYLAPSGTAIRYRVEPMCGDDFANMRPLRNASASSNQVSLSTLDSAPVRPYFNRGIVSTQWVARALQAQKGKSLKALVDPPLGSTNEVRDFLGGVLKKGLLELLAKAETDGAHIYASLFELSDPEIIPTLLKFGQRAHIILSDGTHSAPKQPKGKKAGTAQASTALKRPGRRPYDENAQARTKLRKGHVELHDRMVTGQHFAHHKFIVFTDPRQTTRPVALWTGSTNLTYGGICTQANNGIYIEDATIAGRFLSQWRELVKDVNSYPPTLKKFDASPVSNRLGQRKITAWFAPNPMIGIRPAKGRGNRYGDHPDLKFARGFIRNAQDGILFLVFNPGYVGTLLNDILGLIDNPRTNAKLYVHGVANQDPEGGKNHQPLIFVHRNRRQRIPDDGDIVLPAAVNPYASIEAKDKAAARAMNEWVKKVRKYWREEPTGLGMVRVHSKVVLVDPFGKHPVIITGSHNLGPKASAMNDDNLVIIENDGEAAAQYAVNMITIYNQYRWRFQQLEAAKSHHTLNQWNGLQAPWASQASYLKGDKLKELNFWTSSGQKRAPGAHG